MKDLFTGALGRLNNHGGSKIYTTPNTILVPPEYEIEIGEHGNFISCTLDGRLWLFEDRIIALKWNKEAGKMEYAASKSFSNENFIARGRDWILTDSSVIQVTDESPYIFYETHNEDITPMENFYSLLPALNGFQIIKGYLIRKPNESYENLMYPISMPDIYLTFNGNTIWARTPSGIGKVIITENDGAYSLDFEYSYTFNDNSWQNMGIAFIDDDIFGFKNNQNNKTLCPCSEDTQLYSAKNSSWSALSGNIFFDPFNHSGVVINNNGINLLASEKSIECKGLSQWLAPAKQIQSIDDNAIISSINNSVLATYLNSGLYRGLLLQKALSLTTQAYNSFKLSLGIQNNYKININTLASDNKVLIAIRVANPPNKQWFEKDEILDYTGIIIVAEYSDGTTRDVTKECIFTPNNGTIATYNIGDITASYTENGVTKVIKLNQLEIKIEIFKIFNDEIASFHYPFAGEYILPIFFKRAYETVVGYNVEDTDNQEWYSSGRYEAYILDPITGEFIDVSTPTESIFHMHPYYNYHVKGYYIDNDGTIGIMYIEYEIGEKTSTRYIKKKITHVPIDRIIYEYDPSISINSIDEEQQKINFYSESLSRLGNSNPSASISIQGLKEIIKEYPFSENINYGVRDLRGYTKEEALNILIFSKQRLGEGEWTYIYYDETGYSSQLNPIPSKIMIFKTKVVPNALAINKQIWE